jgi:hypothetical protein
MRKIQSAEAQPFQAFSPTDSAEDTLEMRLFKTLTSRIATALYHSSTKVERKKHFRRMLLEQCEPRLLLAGIVGLNDEIAWYRADGNTNDSRNSNNGTLVGDTTFVTGRTGNAFRFDGNGDQMSIVPTSNLSSLTTTYTFWFNASSVNGTSSLIGRQFADGKGWAAVLGPDGSLKLRVDTSTASNQLVSSGSGLANGSWQYGTVTINDSTKQMSVSVNAGTAVTATYLGILSNSGGTLSLGGTTLGTNWFNGQLDDVRMFNRVLSAAERAKIYSTPSVAKIPNQSIAMSSYPTPIGPLPITIVYPPNTSYYTIMGTAVSATSSNTSLVNPSGIVFGGSYTSRTMTVTPLTNTSGSTVMNVLISDGSNSFSEDFTLSVQGPNAAPVLDNFGTMTFPTITEDDVNNAGSTVAAIIASAGGDRITDSDANAVEGIAITSTFISLVGSPSQNEWQYSLNGGTTWQSIGTVLNTSALLLRASDRVRLKPNSIDGTTGFITFNAWDQTSGTAGTKINATINGGPTSISAASEIANIIVAAINDAPSGADKTITVSQNTHYRFQANDFGFSDPVDNNSFSSVLVTTLPNAAEGKLWFRQNGTTEVAVTANQLVPFGELDRLRFAPVPTINGLNRGAFTFQVRDNGGVQFDGNGVRYPGSSDTDLTPNTIKFAITPNNEPILNNSGVMSLTTITENDILNEGLTIAQIIGSSGFDAITDLDPGAIEGVAIYDAQMFGNKQWQFQTQQSNGTYSSWNSIFRRSETDATEAPLSMESALLLRSNDRVRFLPDGILGGNFQFSFRAWDQTTGLFGTRHDVTVNGQGAAFSSATEQVSINVSSVNDAPAVSSGDTFTISQDSNYTFRPIDIKFQDPDNNSLLNIKISTLPPITDGKLQLGSSDVVLGQLIPSASIGGLKFVPVTGRNGTNLGAFTFQVQDNGGTANGGIDLDSSPDVFKFNITPIAPPPPTNSRPILDNSGTMKFSETTEDDINSTGITVAEIILSAGGDRITDPDPNALEGIVISSLQAGNGSWEFLRSSNVWSPIGSLANNQVLPLRSIDRIRFRPDAKNGSTASITFRAWDQTIGSVGLPTSLSGLGSSISTESEEASITVLSVNDAPLWSTAAFVNLPSDLDGTPISAFLTLAEPRSTPSDVDTGAISGVAIDAPQSWQFSQNEGRFWKPIISSSASPLLLRLTDLIRPMDPDNPEGFSLFLWDQTSGSFGQNISSSPNGGTTSLSSNKVDFVPPTGRSCSAFPGTLVFAGNGNQPAGTSGGSVTSVGGAFKKLSISTRDVIEGEEAFVYVSGLGPTSTATYATRGATAHAGSDFVAKNGSILGQSTFTIRIPTIRDLVNDSPEYFLVDITTSDGEAYVVPVNLREYEHRPGFKVSSNGGTTTSWVPFAYQDSYSADSSGEIRVSEGSSVDLVVDLNPWDANQDFPKDYVINYSTIDWTAVGGSGGAGSDFISKSGTIQVQNGTIVGSNRITIPTYGDFSIENPKSFMVQFSSPWATEMLHVFMEDDRGPKVQIGVAPVNVGAAATPSPTQGLSGELWTIPENFTSPLGIWMDRTFSVPMEFSYRTIAANASTNDFQPFSGTVTILPGKTFAYLPNLQTFRDMQPEYLEKFFIRVETPWNEAFDTTVLIKDEELPKIEVSDVFVTSGQNAVFNVTLSKQFTQQISLNVATYDRSTTGSLYQSVSGFLNFEPGVTQKQVVVPTYALPPGQSGNNTFPSNNKFYLRVWSNWDFDVALGTISNPGGYVLQEPTPVTLTPDSYSIDQTYLYSPTSSNSIGVSVGGGIVGQVVSNDQNLGQRTASVQDAPLSGSLKFNPDGSFLYVPRIGFVGTDKFTYRLSGQSATSNSGVVTIQVDNTPPALFDVNWSYDTKAKYVDVPLNVPFSLSPDFSELQYPNGVSFDTSTLSQLITLVPSPSGFVRLSGIQNLDQATSKVLTFSYAIRDLSGGITTKKVTLTPLPAGIVSYERPDANNDQTTVLANSNYNYVTTSVLANDLNVVNANPQGTSRFRDLSGRGLYVMGLTIPAGYRGAGAEFQETAKGGLVEILANGTYTYKAPPQFTGIDWFDYEIHYDDVKPNTDYPTNPWARRNYNPYGDDYFALDSKTMGRVKIEVGTNFVANDDPLSNAFASSSFSTWTHQSSGIDIYSGNAQGFYVWNDHNGGTYDFVMDGKGILGNDQGGSGFETVSYNYCGWSVAQTSTELRISMPYGFVGDATIPYQVVSKSYPAKVHVENLRLAVHGNRVPPSNPRGNLPPRFVTIPVEEARLSGNYEYRSNAIDYGDFVQYRLDAGPSGMSINASTGVLSWSVPQSFLGDPLVKISAYDYGGASDSQTFTIKIKPNEPPVFVSRPVLPALLGSSYSYDADAVDPDGNAVTYSLMSSPSGMSINAVSGLVTWTPTSSQLGAHSVSIKASDVYGAATTQNYSVYVRKPDNASPRFTSTQQVNAIVGTSYVYESLATDADGDSLRFSKGNVVWPEGYTPPSTQSGHDIRFEYVNAGINQKGVYSWNPPADLAGRKVIVEETVSDNFNEPVIRRMEITVRGISNNQAPVITSQPLTSYQLPLDVQGIQNLDPVTPKFISVKVADGQEVKVKISIDSLKVNVAADIVFAIDVTGSMGDATSWLKGGVVDQIESQLRSYKIGIGINPNQYGLVLFNSESHLSINNKATSPMSIALGNVDTNSPLPLVSPYVVPLAANSQQLWGNTLQLKKVLASIYPGGDLEIGYHAMKRLFDLESSLPKILQNGVEHAQFQYSYRGDAVTSVIMITDDNVDIYSNELQKSLLKSIVSDPSTSVDDVIFSTVLMTKLTANNNKGNDSSLIQRSNGWAIDSDSIDFSPSQVNGENGWLFYDVKNDRPIKPVNNRPFVESNWELRTELKIGDSSRFDRIIKLSFAYDIGNNVTEYWFLEGDIDTNLWTFKKSNGEQLPFNLINGQTWPDLQPNQSLSIAMRMMRDLGAGGRLELIVDGIPVATGNAGVLVGHNGSKPIPTQLGISGVNTNIQLDSFEVFTLGSNSSSIDFPPESRTPIDFSNSPVINYQAPENTFVFRKVFSNDFGFEDGSSINNDLLGIDFAGTAYGLTGIPNDSSLVRFNNPGTVNSFRNYQDTTQQFLFHESQYISLARAVEGSVWNLGMLRDDVIKPERAIALGTAFAETIANKILSRRVKVDSTSSIVTKVEPSFDSERPNDLTFEVTMKGTGVSDQFDLNFVKYNVSKTAGIRGSIVGTIPTWVTVPYSHDFEVMDVENDRPFSLSFDPEFVDADGKLITHGAVLVNSGRDGFRNDRLIWVPPTALTPKTYQFRVIAIDSAGQIGRKDWTVTVFPASEVNSPPTLDVSQPPPAMELRAYQYQLTATDPDLRDRASLRYYLSPTLLSNGSLQPVPSWLNIDRNTGLITGRPGTSDVGQSRFTVVVSDGRFVRDSGGKLVGSKSAATFVMDVQPRSYINTPPSIPPLYDFAVGSGEPVAIRIYAIDSDNDDITFSLTTSPKGMFINEKTGVITWVPNTYQSGSINPIVISVTDG